MSKTSGRAPSPTTAVEAWEALLRVHASLTPALSRLVEEQTGLPLSWYDVLLELNRAPAKQLRMQDLGERVVLSRSRVSRVVDAMADESMVEKVPDPGDGRATLAKMTRAGARAFRRAAPVYLAGISAHFGDHLSEEEIRVLRDGLSRILDAHTSPP